MTLNDLLKVAEYRLNLRSLKILLALRETKTATMSTISASTKVSPPALTRLADHLEVCGYAARRFSADRRVTWLDLTPSGEAVLADIEGGEP